VQVDQQQFIEPAADVKFMPQAAQLMLDGLRASGDRRPRNRQPGVGQHQPFSKHLVTDKPPVS